MQASAGGSSPGALGSAAARIVAVQRALDAEAAAGTAGLTQCEATRRALRSGDFAMTSVRRDPRWGVAETTVIVPKEGFRKDLDVAAAPDRHLHHVESDLEHRRMILDAFS